MQTYDHVSSATNDDWEYLFAQVKKLKFPVGIEAIFQNYYFAEKLLYARFAIVLGIVLYLLNIYTDITLFPHLKRFSLLVRISCSIGAFALLGFTFTSLFRRFHEGTLFLMSIFASCGIILFTYIGSGVPSLLYHSGVMLCMMFLFAFLRIRFLLATLSGWIVVLTYVVPHLVLGDAGINDLMHNSMNLAGIVIVGMTIAYMNQYAARYSFVQSLLIEEKNRDLSDRNSRIEVGLELARGIQEQYLPKAAPSPFFSVCYVPMEKIGGDFYEFINFSDGRTGIFISDVAGHGVPAAIIASMLKITLSSSTELHGDPQALMGHINDVMFRHVNSNFITSIYCIIDRIARTMSFSMAGHNPPLIITGTEVTPLSSSKSLPLGLFSTAVLREMGKPFKTNTTNLPPGSKILLYTDGLTEARKLSDDTKLFEYNGMYKKISSLTHLSCVDFIRGLYNALIDFRGAESFDDDICMICADIS